MGFDGGAGMIHDAHLDDSLYKNADAAFLLGDNDGYHEQDSNLNDKQMSSGAFDAMQSSRHDDSYASEPDDYGNSLESFLI